MLNDPIADMLTRIRNANLQRHRYVDVYKSKMVESLLNVLKESGFIRDFIVQEDRMLRVYLKFSGDREPMIKGLQRVSSPGRRIYVKWPAVPVVRNGLGISIVSTSRGVMHGIKARKEKIGGELICTVW